MAWHAVTRNRNGRYRVRLADEERALLRGWAADLLEALDEEDDAGIQRLFPPAHRGDPVSDAEFHLRRHDDLIAGRRAAVSTFMETVTADTLDEEQLQTWLTALNDLRLVLGTRLDVTEEMDDIVPPDPRAPDYAVYVYITAVLGDAVEAAFGGLG